MSEEQLPIHRWLTFSDSWFPGDVEQLIDVLKVRSSEVVYDPFAGCGTTPLVCACQGLRTFSTDISMLAWLTMYVKLKPPSLANCDHLKQLLDTYPFIEILQAFVSRRFSAFYSDIPLLPLQFLLIAAMLRTQWHEGKPFDAQLVQAEAIEILTEMLEDGPINPRQSADYRTFCCDFSTVSVESLRSYSHDQIVMISSPPFFGSNVNPAKQRLADLVIAGEEYTLPGRSLSEVSECPSRYDLQQISEAKEILSNFDPKTIYGTQVAAYLAFLDRIVDRAVCVGCRAVALEMGPKIIQGVNVPFDDFVASRLALTYKYINTRAKLDAREPTTTIFAY